MLASKSDKEKLIEIIKHRHIYFISYSYKFKETGLPDNLDNLVDTYCVDSLLSLKDADKKWEHKDNTDLIMFYASYSTETYYEDIQDNQVMIDFINEHKLKDIICMGDDEKTGEFHVKELHSLPDNLYKPLILRIMFNICGKENEKC